MRGRTAIPLLSCVLALGLAGCGSGDGTIPEDESSQLLTLLTSTEEAIAKGDCDLAKDFAQEFVTQTGSLPESVDPKVAEELTTAAANLDDLANQPGECTETGPTGLAEEQPEVPSTEEPETTETDTSAEEEPTTSEEEPTTTEEPEDEPTEEPTQEPPSDGGNQGGPSGTPGGGIEPPSGGVGAGGGAG